MVNSGAPNCSMKRSLTFGDRLGRLHVVVVGAHHVERAGRDRVAAGDEGVEEAGAEVLHVDLAVGAGHGAEAAPHVVVGLHAAAEAVDQLAVPARAADGAAGVGSGAGRRIVQDVDEIGRAVDDALLLPHDQRDLLAFGGLGGADVVRARRARDRTASRRRPLVAIEIFDRARRRAALRPSRTPGRGTRSRTRTATAADRRTACR